MSNNYNYLLKYIIVGDSSVGKSNLLMKFAHNKFIEEYQATIGVEFAAKNVEVDKQVYRIQIWDTAGQENFRSITRAYYKNSVCAMVVYDITNFKSFQNVQNWIEDIHNQSPKTVLIILVGNKIDLEDKRAVTKKEGEDFAIEKGFLFYEVSAKTGEQVAELFENKIFPEMSRKYHIGDEEEERDNDGLHNPNDGGVKLNEGNQPTKKKGGCCGGGGKNKRVKQVESQGNEGTQEEGEGEEPPKESQGEE